MASMFKHMPWSAAEPHEDKHGAQQSEEGESLTTILSTTEDRSAFTLLVADCTESMRQGILDIFDPKQTGLTNSTKTDVTSDLANLDIDTGNANIVPEDEEKKELERQQKAEKDLKAREKEVNSASLQELKTAALQHFDQWSSHVIQRVGEVVNSKEEATRQKDQADPKQDLTASRPETPLVKFAEPNEYDAGVDRALTEFFPPVECSLKQLPEEKKVLILHSLLLLLLSLEHYLAESRVLLLHITSSLGLSVSYLGHDEAKVARGLLAAAENLQADEETKKRAEENKGARKWKVGLATVAGAALIGVTGGLAAPLLAAGVGTVMGGLGLGATAAAGYLGSMAGSAVLVGGLFGAYGGRMTGQMMDQYAKEVEDFAFVPVKSAHRPRKIEKEFRRLRVGIGISGWLTDKNEVVEPWKVLGVDLESFALQWELEALMNLGNSLTSMIKSAAWGYAKKEIISHTVFAALSAGLWPLGLLKVSRIIDNPWSVGSYRAQKAGEVLADALINKAQGERPVTLVGYSLGAKVVYTCLHRLAERKAFGLVESVVLMGAPTPSDSADWRMLRSVVAGRVVNVYSTKDYILAFLYRSTSIQLGVAGLQPVENVKGVENVNVSEIVDGHTKYRHLTGAILHQIGFENIDAEELKKEERELKDEESKEATEHKDGKVDADGNVSEQEVKKLEQEVEKKNEQSYIGWAQGKMESAGTSAGVAYEKAKVQWFERKHAAGGEAGPNDPRDGMQSPSADDAYQSMKARSEARKSEEKTVG